MSEGASQSFRCANAMENLRQNMRHWGVCANRAFFGFLFHLQTYICQSHHVLYAADAKLIVSLTRLLVYVHM